MTLLARTTARRNSAASFDNRMRQHLAEQRLEEIVKVAGIADDYLEVDRRGDLAVEKAFAQLYHHAHTEGIRDLVTRTYVAWMRDEAAEEAAVRGSVDGAVTLMKSNNPLFIEGVFVPSDSDPVA